MRTARWILTLGCLLLPLITSAQNSAPIADAGPDQSAYIGEAVVLYGDAIDPDGDSITEWLWTLESSPEGSHPYLSPWETAQRPIFTGDVAGEYVYSLVASDGLLWSAPDSVTITLAETLPGNRAPIADAGPDQSAYIGEPVVLYGDAIDPDGNFIAEWLWTLEFSPEGSHPYLSPWEIAQRPIFSGDVAGEYVYSLVASDGLLWSAPDYVTITLAEILPPVAIASADITSGPVPLTVNFDGSQSYDPQGGELSFYWSFGDSTGASPEPSPTHTYLLPGTYVAALTVGDSLGQADTDTIVITVTDANAPPVVSPTANPTSGVAPLTVQFTANASDPDGDDLTFAWNFGDGGSSAEENPAHTFVASGSYTVGLSVSDGQASTSGSLLIVVDPGLALDVAAVRIHLRGRHSTMGSMSVAADWTGPIPGVLDDIQLIADGISLLDVPFAAFEPDHRDPNVYEYRAQHLRVSTDLAAGQISVEHNQLNMATLDSSNGLEVQLSFGTNTAVQTVPLQEANGNRWVYERQ